ncbi:hypothetical protein [Devosia sp.]|uniref:hypothetical protein n=1 Tax=Devosia sp. TaxID=1871048 RepID=UPI003A94B91A
MTVPSEVDVVVAPETADTGSYVDWPAIIGGIVVASAISLVLLTFGSALGLSFTSFRAGEGASPFWIAIAAALWLIWVQVSSFMAGGYLTGRMRRRHNDAIEEESDVRDGAHGVLVWAGALVIGALIAVSGIGSAANTVGSAAATVTNAAATAADDVSIDPNAYFIDTMFRPAPAAETDAAVVEEPAPATPAAPADDATDGTTTFSPTPVSTPSTTPVAAEVDTTEPVDPEVRAEVGRILAQGAATDGVSEADRTYLAQLVANNTGLTDEEAAARVDDVLTSIETAKEQAAKAAEDARRTALIGAFITAAAFLVSAVGAYWAAQKGGSHRDQRTVFGTVFRRF